MRQDLKALNHNLETITRVASEAQDRNTFKKYQHGKIIKIMSHAYNAILALRSSMGSMGISGIETILEDLLVDLKSFYFDSNGKFKASQPESRDYKTRIYSEMALATVMACYLKSMQISSEKMVGIDMGVSKDFSTEDLDSSSLFRSGISYSERFFGSIRRAGVVIYQNLDLIREFSSNGKISGAFSLINEISKLEASNLDNFNSAEVDRFSQVISSSITDSIIESSVNLL